MSVDNSESSPGLTDYEKDLIESLRAERRRKLGIESATVVPTRSSPEETLQDSHPSLAAPIPSAPPIQQSRPRWTLIMLGSLLAIVAAATTLALLNSNRNAVPDIKKPPGETTKAAAAVVDETAKATGENIDKQIATPVQDPAETVLETMFTSHSSDRRSGRRAFRKALMSTPLDSASRRIYLEVSGDRIRLRSSPGETGSILRTVRHGTYVRVNERSADEWCQVRLPEGREGWMKCDFLKPISQSSPNPRLRGKRKKAARP